MTVPGPFVGHDGPEEIARLKAELAAGAALRDAATAIVDAVGDYYDDESGLVRVGCSQCCDTSLTIDHLRALRAALAGAATP